MTAQIPETLMYEGESLALCNEPLSAYFAGKGIKSGLKSPHTALWRGYVGKWEIAEGRLFLVDLYGELEDGTEVTIETFFPESPERVFAEWFSGTLRIPRGELLEYVHMGYGSVYEEDLLIEIENGVVTGTSVRKNLRSKTL